MNQNNTLLLEKHKDILSFRELSLTTVATYTSYLTTYILWAEEHLPVVPSREQVCRIIDPIENPKHKAGIALLVSYVRSSYRGAKQEERLFPGCNGSAVCQESVRKVFINALAKTLDYSCNSTLQNPDEWKAFINVMFEKPWLPFVKETFNVKGNAIRYLARYSYRTVIANSMTVSVDDDTVTFRYKDYADSNRQKTMTVKGTNFIGMILQHVLSSRFHRVRFPGYLNMPINNLLHYLPLFHFQYEVPLLRPL